MAIWEYQIITLATEMEKRDGVHEKPWERDRRIENSLSEMGAKGWELVAFVPLPHIATGRPKGDWYHAIFKRPSPAATH
jgi:hypothetical protein